MKGNYISNCSNHNKDDIINAKRAGNEIYFYADHSKSQSGKWIPIDKDTW
jgi:hypothetical protein